MGADWSGFEGKMKKWFADVGTKGSGDVVEPNKDTGKTAKKIADEYEKAIMKGKAAVNGNPPMSYNKSALEKAMKGAFDMLDADKTGASVPAAGALMGTGFVGFWTGGMYVPAKPSPGMAVGITNVVQSPGAPIPVSIPGPNEDPGSLAGAIAKAAKSHAGTIAGLHSGTTPPGAPIAVPWVGLQ